MIAPEAKHLPSPLPGLALRGLAVVAGTAALLAMMADLGLFAASLGGGFNKLGVFIAAMFPPSGGGDPLRILRSLVETLAMALAGTTLAILAATPLGFLGARTVIRQPVIHFLFRRALDFLRGVPALVWALIFVAAFGLGPFGGVIALAVADTPSLAKLFAEAIENCDRGPVEGTRAAGGSRLHEIRFALAPQVAPILASQSLYYLESNFRHAAVLGIVGAGGIGFELEERIRIFAFDEVAFIVILYMVAVALLDSLSRTLRSALA